MNCLNLFSRKNKKNISVCPLLKFSPRVLSVNLTINLNIKTDIDEGEIPNAID